MIKPDHADTHKHCWSEIDRLRQSLMSMTAELTRVSQERNALIESIRADRIARIVWQGRHCTMFAPDDEPTYQVRASLLVGQTRREVTFEVTHFDIVSMENPQQYLQAVAERMQEQLIQ